MCDISDLAIAQLPINQRIEGDNEMIAHTAKRVVFVSVQKSQTITEKIAKIFKQTANTPPRTQADIDKRDPKQQPEREITARLKAIGA